MDCVIEVLAVGRRIDGVDTLHEVSFAIRRGEAVALVGPSGSGKTSVLRLIAGLDRPSTGSVLLNGRVASSPEAVLAPPQRGVGMVFQRPALWPHMTVEQNVEFGLGGLDRQGRRKRLEEVLELTHLRGLERRLPHQLSGGEGQRVALARALAPRPNILLLDEPLSALDSDLHAAMLTLFHEVRRETGATMLYVTHDHQEAAAIAERVVRLRKGTVEYDGAWPGSAAGIPR